MIMSGDDDYDDDANYSYDDDANNDDNDNNKQNNKDIVNIVIQSYMRCCWKYSVIKNLESRKGNR